MLVRLPNGKERLILDGREVRPGDVVDTPDFGLVLVDRIEGGVAVTYKSGRPPEKKVSGFLPGLGHPAGSGAA